MKRQSVRSTQESSHDWNLSTLKNKVLNDGISLFSLKDFLYLMVIAFFMMVTSVFVSHYVESHKVYHKNLKQEVRQLKSNYKQLKVSLSVQGNSRVVRERLAPTLVEIKEPAKPILYNPANY